MKDLDDLLDAASRLRGRVTAAQADLDRVSKALVQASLKEGVYHQSAEVIRRLLDQELIQGVQPLEALLQEGLRTVFPEQELSVRVETEMSRGRVEVNIILSERRPDGTLVEGDALEGFGGAVSTVLGIVLRVYLIFKRKLAPILVLDESLPAFDRGRVNLVGSFLRGLAEKMGVSILLVTHETALEESAHRVYTLKELPDGTSGVVG